MSTCRRTTLLGGDMCGGDLKRRKSAFCVAFIQNCGTHASSFPLIGSLQGAAGRNTACEEAVLAMQPGTAGDTTGDTFACARLAYCSVLVVSVQYIGLVSL